MSNPIAGWSKYYSDGVQFWNCALNGRARPEVFTPIIMHNIVGMAIEKLFMALLLYNRKMPDNHRFTDLADSVNKIVPLDHRLCSDLKYMDSLQMICSMHDYCISEMKSSDVDIFFITCAEVKRITDENLPDDKNEI